MQWPSDQAISDARRKLLGSGQSNISINEGQPILRIVAVGGGSVRGRIAHQFPYTFHYTLR
jgi:hypothetical protein